MIIGFTGVAQSGKDTAAQVLIKKHDFERVSFADSLRAGLYALNPLVLIEREQLERSPFESQVLLAEGTKTYLRRDIILRLSHLVDVIGWEAAKSFEEVRKLLQRYGTEAGRDIFGEDIWVNTTFKRAPPEKNWAVTDVRFENEAWAVKRRGGSIVRVLRDGYAPVNSHVSDSGLPDELINYTVRNNDTIGELHASVLSIMSLINFRSLEVARR